MEKNIEDYLIIFPNFLDKEFCENAIISLEENPDLWSPHYFGKPGPEEYEAPQGPEVIDSVNYKNTINDIILEKLYPIIQQYLNIINLNCFQAWSGYLPIRFTRHSLNCKLLVHWDKISDSNAPYILSFLGVLNDDYEGG